MLIEKLLKALYAKNNKGAPDAPKTHDLLYLAEKLNLELTEEQGGDITPEYGRKLYLELAKRLTKKMGKGFSSFNLFNMRNFYITYPIVQTPGQFKK